MTPSIVRDRKADAIYVRLRPGKAHRTEPLDDARTVDFGADGRPIGVEFLAVSRGVDLDGVPESEAIAALLTRRHIKLYA